MHTLHPLVSSVDLTWLRGQGVEVNPRVYTPAPAGEWLRSPLYWLLSNEQWELRRNLRGKDVVREFPVFAEFRDLGATDYLALMTPFGDPETAFERRDGIVTSWVSDTPDGFSDHHIEAIKHLQPYVGLVSKLTKHDYTARNVLSAYLGEDAGRRVLEGQIRLGDVEHIPAVIWFSDLRDSTAMAERMPVETFLQAVNAYFDCTAGPVLEHGGEVLRFIGDAVLAVFPVATNESPARAANQALAASREARQRLAALNERRAAHSEEQLAFGLGLHVGDLLYGNIGVPTRIEFSVIGPAANEVSRLESLTKEVGEPVLVSRAFKEAVDLPWRNLGVRRVKGVGDGMELFAPPEGI
ncbi:adenylate/guanylate cyclase domain-containing protein [Gammaproteobacteria bacterium]|nr:adenylate/guanylate cyclase domain-containing protein [Gammaproteobacteria bacterium]